jgi:hypothetical protein
MRTAESVGFLQNGFEYRREVGGRGIDDPKHLGSRSLAGECLVALASKVSNDLLRIG